MCNKASSVQLGFISVDMVCFILSLPNVSRLAHKDDCLDRKLYPLLTHKHRVMTRKCAVCHVYIGRCVEKRSLFKWPGQKTTPNNWLYISLNSLQVVSVLIWLVFFFRWLTTNDPFAPNDPCLFCERCFRMLHYDKKGNKLGQFLAYPYVDPGAFNWDVPFLPPTAVQY
jgi:snRNA-activating protein complex subunit 3